MDVNKSNIVIYQTNDGRPCIDVRLEKDTVWLTVDQLVLLFERNRSTIQRHIQNIYMEGELSENTTCAKNAQVGKEGTREVTRIIPFYNLDMIISLGYRVKSQRGVNFRIWANKVLKDYLIRGVAVNNKRLNELSQTIQVLKRNINRLDSQQVLSVVEQYTRAMTLLDDYDHQQVSKPYGEQTTYILSYEECVSIIHSMCYSEEGGLFGNEKDASFHSSINAIYQTFDGKDVYPSVEEKAANLLYFITKNHSFTDGNKRIAATIFLYFLQKNGRLYTNDNVKRISDSTLVAITLMIAESRPEEKEIMTNLIMHFLVEE